MFVANTLARPYAKAIFELAKADGDYTYWRQFLLELKELLQQQDIEKTLMHPFISAEDKVSCITKCLAKDYSGLSLAFIEVLIRESRILLLGEIFTLFEGYRREATNSIEVKVVAAHDVASTEKQQLQQHLETVFAKDVDLNVSVNKDLLGGARLMIQDKVIDNSIAGKIEMLAKAIS